MRAGECRRDRAGGKRVQRLCGSYPSREDVTCAAISPMRISAGAADTYRRMHCPAVGLRCLPALERGRKCMSLGRLLILRRLPSVWLVARAPALMQALAHYRFYVPSGGYKFLGSGERSLWGAGW